MNWLGSPSAENVVVLKKFPGMMVGAVILRLQSLVGDKPRRVTKDKLQERRAISMADPIPEVGTKAAGKRGIRTRTRLSYPYLRSTSAVCSHLTMTMGECIVSFVCPPGYDLKVPISSAMAHDTEGFQGAASPDWDVWRSSQPAEARGSSCTYSQPKGSVAPTLSPDARYSILAASIEDDELARFQVDVKGLRRA
jgi:hypothetical protein